MIAARGLRPVLRPEWAALLLLACSSPAPEAPAPGGSGSAAATHPAVRIDPALADAVELVSVERLEPGRNNRLELLVTLRNTGAEPLKVQSQLTWLSASGGMRGGQTFDHSLPPGGQAVVTAPTNDRQVADFRLKVGPVLQPAVPEAKPRGLLLSAPEVEARAQGSLAVVSRGEEVAYRVLLSESDCRHFRLQPGNRCEAEARTPAGSTTTFLVEYEAPDERPRSARLRIDFEDPLREDLDVALRGRVGAAARSTWRVTLD